MNADNLLVKQPFDPSPYRERAQALLEKMTVAEKIGQLHLEHVTDCVGLTDCNLGDRASVQAEADHIRAGGVGTMLLKGRDVANYFQRIAVEESRLGIPLLFGFDVIHGHKTVFPVPLGEAATWDPQMLEEAETYAAREAYADGVNWMYAPMIDLCRDPRWGRVAEGSGEDPLLGSLIAQAKVQGTQVINPVTGAPYVAACFKHFCCYGLSQGGRDYEECDASERTIFMDYMKPYQAAVDGGSLSAMCAFSAVNGEAITGSYHYLTEVLRERLGFRGFVCSDYGAVAELAHHRVVPNVKEAARKAVTAGVDQDMGSGSFKKYGVDLYHEDAQFAAAVDEAVLRVLCVKFAMGLFEHPYFDHSVDHIVLARETREAARNVGRHSMVLLKNEENILPLSRDKKYFLTGPLSDNPEEMPGAWANYQPDTDVITVKRAMKEAGIDFLHSNGCSFTEKYCFEIQDQSGYDQALEMAAQCDEIIYVLGERNAWSGENRGRVILDVPQWQLDYLRELKKTGKKIISVLMCGRAMACRELAETSDALMLAWHLGTESGHSIVDVLWGDYCPSGRLPITFPKYTGQVPYYHSWLSSGRDHEPLVRYKEGGDAPLYPFGYGLSYANLTIDAFQIDKTEYRAEDTLFLQATVTNHSDMDACEVVQVYFQDVVSSLATPDRKLCGFAKVLVPAHGTAQAQVKIPVQRLALMTHDLQEVVEPGEFILFAGHDSTCGEVCRLTVV